MSLDKLYACLVNYFYYQLINYFWDNQIIEKTKTILAEKCSSQFQLEETRKPASVSRYLKNSWYKCSAQTAQADTDEKTILKIFNTKSIH